MCVHKLVTCKIAILIESVLQIMLGRQCFVPPDFESDPIPDFDSHVATNKSAPNMPKNRFCGRAAQVQKLLAILNCAWVFKMTTSRIC